MHYVFVYGTLCQQERNHKVLGTSHCVSVYARVNGQIIDTGFGFPGLVEEEGTVVGELYEISEDTLQSLDTLEGYYGPNNPHNLYERKNIEVTTDKRIYSAWTYTYCVDTDGLPRFSDWKLRSLERESHVVYFAYGSCADMKRIVAAGREQDFSEVIGCGILNGFNLQFSKYSSDGNRADVVETGGHTEGKLYQISSDVLTGYLYSREGVYTKAYRPIIVNVAHALDLLDPDQSVEAVTFVAVSKSEEQSPPLEYMEEVLRGLKPIVSEMYYGALLHRFVHEFEFENKEWL
ncbi:gamma-glutamylcyclotransferase [Paenibacillus cremeus]|uniref:Gamma-glutamylcyclotransferase family protein n=1 Tax=Paenibacillus cremeus TaxID=2163881 RepID=A0A559K8B2_9BACL|nr:gamma-glutamylcyclotransferase family protein [Paenibacillus cremeus]TVY08371.1 hypothetical protein FPZ49_19200 [Paenibacillus cremeus]